MSALVASLAGVCAELRFADKRLLAPTRRVGRQWVDAMARSGSPALGLRVETVRSLALELAAPGMAAAGLALVPRREALLLVEAAVELAPPARLRYLSDEAVRAPGFAAALHDSLDSLRLAGVGEERLRRGVLEDDRKAADLRLLLEGYLGMLARQRLVDYAGVLRIALARLAKEPGALGPGAVVLLPDDLERRGLEAQLLEALPPAALRGLGVDAPGWGGDLELATAVGEENEIRAVLRAGIAGGIPLDEIELLHTDADTYVPLVLEVFSVLGRPGANPGDEPPVTFAEGIPCDRSRPGRALAAWLRWDSAGHPQSGLVAMVREGLLETGEPEEQRTGFARLAALLRGVGIGLGRDRYLPKLDARIVALRRRLELAEGGRDEGDDGAAASAARLEAIRRDLAGLGVLRILAARLLDLPLGGAGGASTVGAARTFVATLARRASRLDGYAAERLEQELRDMELWLGRTGTPGLDMRAWVGALPGAVRVLGSGPRPGCLHVDRVATGGHSGRERLFVVGLDEGRFPGAGLQDPLLLDRERERLAGGMPTAAGRLSERLEGFRRLLGRQRGRVTLSWSSRDVIGDRELHPSPVVLEAFRALVGDPEAEQGALVARAASASFAPRSAAECLDPAEWWLWRLTGDEEVSNAAALAARLAPHLERGREAAAARRGAAFTAWDGRVPDAGPSLDPTSPGGRVISAGGLEAAGACPLRFFYRYGLGIAPPEELVLDPGRWLDPLARGLLLHGLFEEFLRGLAGAGRLPPVAARDRAALEALLEERVAAARDDYPPPSEAAFRRERAELGQVAATFLADEEEHCRESGSEPAYLEASLGMAPGRHATAIDSPEPVPVELPGGGALRARGRIDRVDRRAEGYVVWDYKTGSSFGYERADPFVEGRKIQPWLYVRMVERRLREAVAPGARVLAAGYFFPGVRAAGERMSWTAERLGAEGGAVAARLARLVASGAFAPTTDHRRDCEYCDFRPACGDVAAIAAGARRKVAAEALLEPLRELRAASLAGAAGGGEEGE